MINRKGFLALTYTKRFCQQTWKSTISTVALSLTLWIVPVSADETADDILAMMGWWQEYGRYWDEIGADTAGLEDELSFAGLEEFLHEATTETEEVVQDKTAEATEIGADMKVIMAKRSEP